MSQYYNPNRKRNLFAPQSTEPYRLSRSKIDLFLNCPRCFYLDRRLGVGQPPGYPFNLNSAVDRLLKKEFDAHRIQGKAHPLMEQFRIDAVPFAHEKMDEWRDSLHKGVTHLHQPTNFLVTGGVDDIWVKPNGELIVVDYKATSKESEVTLDAEWQIGYKRQMEFYQWLLRRNGFSVSSVGYFVYCNGDSARDGFNGKLHFDVKVIPYDGDDSWVESTLVRAKDCLESDYIPITGVDCDYCKYRKAAADFENDEDPDYRPKTVKQAVERFIELWNQDDIDLLTECPRNRLDFLISNLQKSVIVRCEVNSANVELLEACGSRDMHPEDASKIIIRALWEDLHP